MTSYEPIYTFLTKDGSKLKYKCNLCPGQKLISAQTTSNYGLTRHLKTSFFGNNLGGIDFSGKF